MKLLIASITAFLFIGCSSAKKQPDASQTKTPPPAAAVNNTAQNTPKMDADIIKKEVCEAGKDKRFLEVHKKTDGCDLAYKKFGKEKIVASGKYGVKHCQDSLDKITKKLEADKFDCHEN